MTLSFSTQLNGEPTHFVSKIWRGLERMPEATGHAAGFTESAFRYIIQATKRGLLVPYMYYDCPKIHTIRADPHDRWITGRLIHFVVFNRSPNRFQFAPVLPVKGIQKIEIEWFKKEPIVVIDRNCFYNPFAGIDHGMELLARNDGFASVEDFFKYFNTNYDGKIIHWTDYRY